jgi:lipopolysaccharide biosynthesis glycosyltransferase
MLPETVNRVLYLDSDMVVTDSLSALWQTDLQGNIAGAVQDFVNDQTKGAVGLSPEEPYLNAGLWLIDLEAWRREKVEEACLGCIQAHGGTVTHHDQGVLNEVLRGRCSILPIRYNLMTIHYLFDRRQLKKYYQDHASFYSEEEVEEAKNHPAILHYTPSFTTRPWVAHCKHPKKHLYWDALQKTPFRGCAVSLDSTKWYVRLINWRYRHLPY